MKKQMILILAILLNYAAVAQTDLKKIPSIDYYGIDFSLTKIYGATENPIQFPPLFHAINELVIHEYARYNVGKYFKKTEVEPLLEVTAGPNNAIDPAQLFTINESYKITQDQLAALVQHYNITPKHKIGLVIVGEILNKTAAFGNYWVVFFDTDTRAVLQTKQVSGKAGGFGLRNYWARSVYNLMRSWTYPNTH